MRKPCLLDGILFTSQSQIDNFPTNYPGCTEILGDVKIDGEYNIITNLKSLSNVTLIGGDLRIEEVNLVNLVGLDNVTSIVGNLSMYQLDDVTNLTGLENLTSVGGFLGISLLEDGKAVMQTDLVSSEIDISLLLTGIYFIQVSLRIMFPPKSKSSGS